MNNFHEFTLGGCTIETFFVHHKKCGWYWDDYDLEEDITLDQLIAIVNKHVCEEGQ